MAASYTQINLGALELLADDMEGSLRMPALARKLRAALAELHANRRRVEEAQGDHDTLIAVLSERNAEIGRLRNAIEVQVDLRARIAQLGAELSDWRQPNMLTEVEYRERTAKLERVRVAADKVAAYLTIEAEFSGDEADHSGLYELDAALGVLAVEAGVDFDDTDPLADWVLKS